jgi:hypothetical protein
VSFTLKYPATTEIWDTAGRLSSPISKIPENVSLIDLKEPPAAIATAEFEAPGWISPFLSILKRKMEDLLQRRR